MEQRGIVSNSLQMPKCCPSCLEYSALSFQRIRIPPGSFLVNVLGRCPTSTP